MRIFFTFGVLFNHTVNKFTLAMSQSETYYTVRTLRVMFHYTRMGFIFISGVVLTLTYFNRNDWPTFLKKIQWQLMAIFNMEWIINVIDDCFGKYRL